MFIRVDKVEEEIEGFDYANKDGRIERIEMQGDRTYFKFIVSDGNYVNVYYEDIPKLIKALEAALKQYKETQ